MFNLNRSQENNNSNDKNIKSDWLNFSSNQKKDDLLKNLAENNKFIKDELKLRSMVIEMIEKEFGKNIKNIRGYEYLVDSVINRLKNKQLELEPHIQEK